MTPEPYPTPWRWVDLGLPSGTLWLDRFVGAPSQAELGLYYQWGDIIGHSVSDDYQYTEENYVAKGLNLIQSNIDDAHDAARAFYGPLAKMPSLQNFQELLQYTTYQEIRSNVFQFTSTLNGEKIVFPGTGYFDSDGLKNTGSIYAWSSNIGDSSTAYAIHDNTGVQMRRRRWGFNVMAVHS